ncbi:MAG TPA: GGDEF domain-containing protein [Candidatus Limnocylindrales bacterium]|nr:GGDEF domain-containing protein [Candidatus Limnocylindrales bacterium]
MTRPSLGNKIGDTEDRGIRRSWLIFSGSFVLLGLIAALRIGIGGAHPLDWVLASLVVVVGIAAFRHRQAVDALEVGRRAEAESFARILQGLSRSISADAIVEAIVEEIGTGTGADHIVVVRRRPDARVLEATLVNSRTGGPSSSTLFPISDLEDPPDNAIRPPLLAASPQGGRRERGGRRRPVLVESSGPRAWPAQPDPAVVVAERIAARARSVYGLKHTISAPLTTDDGPVGAIVASRRTAEGWPASAERILAGAAVEASAALARAYSHRQAEERASTDALTGLPNRRYFDEFCALLARRRRANDAVGILMVDIDRFKVLNDTYGHAVGDEVLRAVAGALASAVREDDVPARYGGEEFAVLLRNPSLDVAIEVGERVREAVAALDLSRHGVAGTSVSVGVAVAQLPDQAITDIIVAADGALYEAKRRGRDRVIAAPPPSDQEGATGPAGATGPLPSEGWMTTEPSLARTTAISLTSRPPTT